MNTLIFFTPHLSQKNVYFKGQKPEISDTLNQKNIKQSDEQDLSYAITSYGKTIVKKPFVFKENFSNEEFDKMYKEVQQNSNFNKINTFINLWGQKRYTEFTPKNIQIAKYILDKPELSDNKNFANNLGGLIHYTDTKEKENVVKEILKLPEDILNNEKFAEKLNKIVYNSDTDEKAYAKVLLIQKINNAKQNKSELLNNISDELGDIVEKVDVPTSLENIVLARNIGVRNINLNNFLKGKKENFSSKVSEGLTEAKEKYKLDIENLEINDGEEAGDENYLRLENKSKDIFKFDSKTGELISVGDYVKAHNIQTGTISKLLLQYSFFDMLRRDIFSDIDIIIKKDTGEKISHDKYMKSKIKGEYEIYSVDPNGKRYLTGLAEIDKNGGKHIEKTLTSLDGTKTQTVYADDKKGNIFNFYQIKDKDGKILYESTKKRKTISKNHYQTFNKDSVNKTETGYDIEIKNGKVVVKQLNPSEPPFEYSIAKFSRKDYKYINKKAPFLNTAKYKNWMVDEKLLPVLTKMSGEEWDKLFNSGTKLIAGNYKEPYNAASVFDVIMVSSECKNSLSTVLHEAGHQNFDKMDLINDEKLEKVYKYEKELYTSTFPDGLIVPVEYFLNDNGIRGVRRHGKGRDETVAESNSLINTYNYDAECKARGILLQQYFPRTIAYIANKMAMTNR